MCDPLTIAGIALSAGSTALNTVANNKAASARADALRAERTRQSGLDQQADAVNARSQGRYENFDEKQAQTASDLGSYLAAQTTPEAAPAETAPIADTSQITVQEEARQKGKARASTDATAVSLGNLRSFGDLLGEISRGQARDAGEIGQIGGFKAGYANVLPYDLEAAANKGAGLRTFADLAGGAGSLALGAGLSGKTLGDVTGIFSKGAKGVVPGVTSIRPKRRPGTVSLASLY
jgi:hypothetical protein